MKRRMSMRGLLLISLLLAGIGFAIVPQLARPMLTSAQTPVLGLPVAACGQVSVYNFSTTSTGHITLTNGNVVADFVTAPGLSPITASGVSVGSQVCLVGTLNAANQLVTAIIRQDLQSSLTLCGIITAYTAATVGTQGSITIAGLVIPIAYGGSFNGAVPLNGNYCVQVTINGVGQITGGTITPNTNNQTSTGAPVSVCGQVAGFTAATATAAGNISFSTANVVASYAIPAGKVLGFTPATGEQLCLVGTVSPTNALLSVIITSNVTSSVTVCGVVTAYTAATTSARGALNIRGTVIPLAYGATFTGTNLGTAATAGSNVCVTGTEDALGQLNGGSVTANTNVTATVTPTATVPSNPGPPPPPPPGGTATPTPTTTPTPTVTPTFTPVPPPTSTPTATATATATATSTPVPPPPSTYKPTFKSISVWYSVMRIGTVETVTVQAKKKAKHGIRMHVVFATGRRFDFSESTNSKGFWSKSFRVPTDTISKYSHQAVVELELFYKSKVTRTYRTFLVIR